MKGLMVYRVNVGSCNGCDIEVLSALASRFELADMGVGVASEPGEANALLVVGAVNAKTAEHLKQVYQKIKPPRMVVAVGACAFSSGAFSGSYSVANPTDELIPVNAYVPGCPPSPHAIADALAGAVRAKPRGWRAPEDFRGVPEVDAEECTGCGACAQVCPAGAIEVLDEGGKRKVRFEYAKCISCAFCEEACPEDAVKLAVRYPLAVKSKGEAVDEAELALAKCASCGTPFVPPGQLTSAAKRIMEGVPEYVESRYAIERSMMLCLNCRSRLESIKGAKGLLLDLSGAVQAR